MNDDHGFTLVELLVATAIVLIVTAGLFALVSPGASGSRTRAAAVDIQQRMRAASEALAADLAAAGTGPVNGISGHAIGAVAATVLPFRVGWRGDPDGTARSDALTVLASPGLLPATRLVDAWNPGAGPANVALVAGCPVGDPSCGFRAGGAVLLVDGRGQSDAFRIDAVDGTLLSLVPRGRTSGRGFPAGAAVVPVVVGVYYFKPDAAADSGQLMSGDGDLSDLPLVDHVVRLSFQLMGDPRPPAVMPGPGPPRASYGPSPPPVGEDDARDGWPAGENCTFTATPAGHVSRLAALRPGTGLVPLAAAVLTDGPWCPDAAAPGRYDADLLRVRAVRVTLRLEATASELRGSDPRLFAHPGSSRDRSSPAADQEVTFDVVPRALQLGR